MPILRTTTYQVLGHSDTISSKKKKPCQGKSQDTSSLIKWQNMRSKLYLTAI